jgi:hypothetical protein
LPADSAIDLVHETMLNIALLPSGRSMEHRTD